MANTTGITFYSTVASKLNDIPVESGNLIFVRDVRKIYLDSKNERTEYSVIITVETDEVRVKTKKPVKGFYFVSETNRFWRYDGQWIALTADPQSATVFLDKEEDLPTTGKTNCLYVAGTAMFRYIDGEFVDLNRPRWENF